MAKDPLEGFKPQIYHMIIDDGKRDKNGQEKYFYLANVGISKTFSDLDPAHPVYAVQLLINKFPVACDGIDLPDELHEPEKMAQPIRIKVGRSWKQRKPLCNIIITDRLGLYVGLEPVTVLSGMDEYDQSAYWAAGVIRLRLNYLIDAVMRSDTTNTEKDARIRQIIKMVEKEILYRGNLRRRTHEGFERLLQQKTNELIEHWKALDQYMADTDSHNKTARVKRQITLAYKSALLAYNPAADPTDEFIKSMRAKTQEAALFGASGRQKTAYLVLARLVDACRFNGGKIDGAEFIPESTTGQGGTLNVTPEKFLSEMGFQVVGNRMQVWRLKREIRKELTELRDKPYTVVQNISPDGSMKFEQRANLFSFAWINTPAEGLISPDKPTIDNGNDILWQFSGLSLLALPIAYKTKGKTPFEDTYDNIRLAGLRFIHATCRREVADIAASFLFPVLIRSATEGSFADIFPPDEEGLRDFHKKRPEVRKKIFEIIKEAAQKDGIKLDITPDGAYSCFCEKTADELEERRERAAQKKMALSSKNTAKG